MDKQQTISNWFDHLMENVERNLSMKNRDKWVFFTPHSKEYTLLKLPFKFIFVDSAKIYRYSVAM